MKNNKLVILLFLIVISMIGMSFAAVPLYRIFCQVTGFAGTPQINKQATNIDQQSNINKYIKVTFDSNINQDLPWSFRPKQLFVNVQIGKKTTAFYLATNLSDKVTRGTARFNVTPVKAAAYFVKIDCFCFEDQTLKPRQSVDMPVLFYIDPEILNDFSTEDLKEITLSYTFFKLDDKEEAK